MESRIRVCQVITRLIVGGAQETAILTCARLDPDRFDPWLVTGPQTGAEGELHSWGRELGVRIEVEPVLVRQVSPRSDLLALLRLRRYFRRQRPDVVHTNSSKAGILGRLAARMAGVPVVVHTVHGWSFHDHMSAGERAVYVALERWVARFADRLVLVTERDREKGLAAGIGRPEDYVLIRSGIDLEPFRRQERTAAEVRAELDVPLDAPVVGTVSRLSPQKDPLAFVEAAARILGAVPEAHFVLVGDGPLRPDVEERARRLGIAERLRLTGIRRDVPDLLGGFDAFLLTSRWEGLPRTVPQAMAAGVPVIAAAVDGVIEALEDGESGLFVPPGDVAALAEAAVRVIQDRDLASRLAEGGRRGAEAFDEASMVRRLEDLYEELVGEVRRGPNRGSRRRGRRAPPPPRG